ncbi:MAG: PorT family protein [Bacteroidales bacterium]|nr:PorT family protein [Bacteroidales bacterium]
MKKILLTFAVIMMAIWRVGAQDTIKKVDIYKEFNLNSFSDATIKIKDSSVLSQHLIGIKGGYGISNVSFSQDIDHKSFKTPKNFGVYYTYYHSLWKSMPYFGIQTGIEYNEIGYTHLYEVSENNFEEKDQIYQSIQIPLLSQFRIDFWKMRIMVGAGPYGYYIISTGIEEGIPETTNRYGVGLMGTGGIAFVVKPVEFHLEAAYKYAMSYFCDPKIYSKDAWTYTHSNQLIINLGVFFRLGK